MPASALSPPPPFGWLTKPGLLGYRVLARYGLPFRMPVDDGMVIPEEARTGVMNRKPPG